MYHVPHGRVQPAGGRPGASAPIWQLAMALPMLRGAAYMICCLLHDLYRLPNDNLSCLCYVTVLLHFTTFHAVCMAVLPQ
jgi:hypothetical protein